MSRTYLYGVIASGGTPALTQRSVDGVAPVYVIQRPGLGAVVSEYIGEPFASLPKEDLLRYLLGHQRVLENLMQGCGVLPVKFGTLLGTPSEVWDLLAQGRAALSDALRAVDGHVEVEVAATWDVQQVLQQIAQEGEIAQAREAVVGRGQPTDAERVQLGQMVKGALDRRREQYRERVQDVLGLVSEKSVSNALLSDEMVVNEAFLVEDGWQEGFDLAVRRLDSLFQGNLSFRVIGPLPPYSFSTVEVARVTKGQVEEAQRVLGLGDALSEQDVREAYRRRAAQVHRNTHAWDTPSQGALDRVRWASQVLVNYCRSWYPGQQSGESQGPVHVWEDRYVITVGGARQRATGPGGPSASVNGVAW